MEHRGAASLTSAIVIGASTGGPSAISKVVKSLPADLSASVFVSMHMPQWLTTPFVHRLANESKIGVKAAGSMEQVCAHVVAVTPGGWHLTFAQGGSGVHTVLMKRLSGDIYTPSVDKMFSSAAELWGPRLTAVVLTGMGNDGEAGVRAVKAKGGFVVAESNSTAVIYNMPSAAIATGCVDLVMPLGEIGKWLASRYAGFSQ